ncbi:BPSL1445 family SYLF domain-containing lipoprotein [Hyphococcus sp.]|uniref:BPSL1445 family SYLF domain-containing lipoprotein n=1 Tax=Hyphococcus sp. TaxID=2038636 RepID=UPI0035C68670
MTMSQFFKPVLAIAVMMMAVTGAAEAAKPAKIDRRVDEALADFREDIGGGEAVLTRAKGVLVFPLIRKGGIGIGGEYGQGALRIGGDTVAYYSTAAASIGLQFGGQSRRQIIVFLDQGALDKFRSSQGWEIGVDASVAVVTVGAGGAIDTTQLNQPIVAFVFDNKGLMYNLSLEGSKISEIHRD